MEPILISAAALIVLVFVLFAMFAKFYRKIQQGHALIVNTMRAEPTVTFTGCMVYPVNHKAELMERMSRRPSPSDPCLNLPREISSHHNISPGS